MPDAAEDRVPLELCVLPDHIWLSQSAWQKAANVGRAASDQTGLRSYIVGFVWAEGRRLQRSPDTEVEDKGPGLMLGFYERSQFSPDAIHNRNGVECVVVIPSAIMSKAVENLIDTDESVWGGLVLR